MLSLHYYSINGAFNIYRSLGVHGSLEEPKELREPQGTMGTTGTKGTQGHFTTQ